MTTSNAPFRLIQEGNVSVLELLPELNQVQWGEIDSIGTRVLSSMEQQQQPNMIVDLSHLNYMGSAMVALIVRVWKATLAKKGKLCVVCPHSGVKEVLKLASLDKHWAIVETLDDAHLKMGLHRSRKGDGLGEPRRSGLGGWIAACVLLMICVVLAVLLVRGNWLDLTASSQNSPVSEQTFSDEKLPAPELGAESETPEESIEESLEATAPPTIVPETSVSETTLPEVSDGPSAQPETAQPESPAPEATAPETSNETP